MKIDQKFLDNINVYSRPMGNNIYVYSGIQYCITNSLILKQICARQEASATISTTFYVKEKLNNFTKSTN